jgi:hypothetical protein
MEDWVTSVTDDAEDVEEDELVEDFVVRDDVGWVLELVMGAAVDMVDAGFADTEEELVVELADELPIVLVEDALLVLNWDVVNKDTSFCW